MDTLPAAVIDSRRPVNLRSVLLGLIGVTFVCVITPYNNYVMNNVDFIANPLSVGMMLFFSIVVIAINAPLHRWKPRWALSTGELTVAMGMTLVASALPAVGLMRYLPGHLTAFWAHAAARPDFAQLLGQLHLPDWAFPTFGSTDPAQRGAEPVIQDFVGRVPGVQGSFFSQLFAVPWAAWVMPTLTWGVFFAFLFGGVLLLSILLRRQWMENERLPFPLADVFQSLIDAPAPGRVFNALFTSRAFWVAAAAVFTAQSLNALNVYMPSAWPAVPLRFDLRGLFVDPPWSYTEFNFKVQTISFTIIGITYVIQSRVAFSLWFCFVLLQIVLMVNGQSGVEISNESQTNQSFGALLAMGLSILWVGRGQWAAIGRQMVRGHRPGEPEGAYFPYVAAGWGLVVCLVGLVTWLTLAGTTVVAAVVFVGVLMLMYVVLARVVSETGMLYVLIPVPLTQPMQVVGYAVAGGIQSRTTLSSYFWGRFVTSLLAHDLREALPPYAMHAIRIYEPTRTTHTRSRPAAYILCLALALGVAYLVSGASSLYIHYNYASTIDQSASTPLNEWGTWAMPASLTLDPTARFAEGRSTVDSTGNPIVQTGLGAAITTVLSVLTLRYGAWPIHPFGYLLVFTWGIRQIWFSLMLGWLCKSLILRIGGASLYRRARGLFLGLVFGEIWSIGFWMIVALVHAFAGSDFHAISVLP